MAKYLRFIGFLILALALWQTASGTFIDKTVDEGKSMDTKSAAMFHQQSESYIAVPQFPYLPEAELAGGIGQSQLLNFLRVQRSFAIEYVFSLKDWVDMLAQRDAVLSLHREKLYDTSAYYRCHPVCEYYIFTLRRILI